jgi:4-aminobutyrate aminotransferase
MLARESLNVASNKALGHYTHEKNPVACAAGLATLDVIEEEKLVQRAEALGQKALEQLRRLGDRHATIGDVRGLGLLLGVELLTRAGTPGPANDRAERVMYAALRCGLNFKITMGNILTLTPSLTISDSELSEAVAILDQALAETDEKTVP